MILVTGDCHGDWLRFGKRKFPLHDELTREDLIIVCGDFGIWTNSKEEQYNLDWLASKPFTIAFCDGNHENFDRLYSDEFEIVNLHGARAHKIRENVFHILRGEILEWDGKSIFFFGGARSHDIQDGILRLEDYPDKQTLHKDCRRLWNLGKLVRIEHEHWWKEEMPSENEWNHGMEVLAELDNKVDLIITHCAPTSAQKIMSPSYESDWLTNKLEELLHSVEYDKWYCGHYHENRTLADLTVLYEKIEEPWPLYGKIEEQ